VLVPLNVSSLGRGIYRYDPVRDALVGSGDESRAERVMAAFAIPEAILSLSRASLVVLLIGRPWRSMRKYGPRGMRFVFLEAGAIAENVHIAVQALGLGSCDCASLFDDEVHDALGVDGRYQALVHGIVIGSPT
jgi:SagB-type dehydrogenase family enzyme